MRTILFNYIGNSPKTSYLAKKWRIKMETDKTEELIAYNSLLREKLRYRMVEISSLKRQINKLQTCLNYIAVRSLKIKQIIGDLHNE